jgi:hypothetical protein
MCEFFKKVKLFIKAYRKEWLQNEFDFGRHFGHLVLHVPHDILSNFSKTTKKTVLLFLVTIRGV